MIYTLFDIEAGFAIFSPMNGIYKIQNTVNDKVYIGSSMRVESRLKEHRRVLRRKVHHSQHLQAAFDAYGEPAFEFTILETVENAEQLFNREQYWAEHYKSTDRQFGYNVRMIASSNRGNKVVLSQEARQKISRAMKGRMPANIELVRERRASSVTLTINGILQDTFKSQREAARLTGVNHHAINNQAKGHTKIIRTHPGYVFSYKIPNT